MAFLRFQCDAEDLAEFNGNVGLTSREVILCPITDTEVCNSVLEYPKAETLHSVDKSI
jgi:hypothetical protein